jgi:hypothetical protein
VYLNCCAITAEARIVEQVEAVIARQQHSKHVSMATDTVVAIDNSVFSMRFAPGCIIKDSGNLTDRPSSREMHDSQICETVRYCHV